MGSKLCTTVSVCSDVASTKQLYRALKLFNTVSSYSPDCLMTYIYSIISTLSNSRSATAPLVC